MNRIACRFCSLCDICRTTIRTHACTICVLYRTSLYVHILHAEWTLHHCTYGACSVQFEWIPLITVESWLNLNQRTPESLASPPYSCKLQVSLDFWVWRSRKLPNNSRNHKHEANNMCIYCVHPSILKKPNSQVAALEMKLNEISWSLTAIFEKSIERKPSRTTNTERILWTSGVILRCLKYLEIYHSLSMSIQLSTRVPYWSSCSSIHYSSSLKLSCRHEQAALLRDSTEIWNQSVSFFVCVCVCVAIIVVVIPISWIFGHKFPCFSILRVRVVHI